MNKAKMNGAQMILNLILKMNFYDEFKSSLTSDEQDFIISLKSSKLNGINLSILHDSKTSYTCLTWISSPEEYMGCFVTHGGFVFSKPITYKHSTKKIKDEPISSEKMEIIQEQIQKLKEIFLSYSQDAEVFFK